MSCMIVVASLYWSSSICSMSAIASSKACLAKLQALEGSFSTCQLALIVLDYFVAEDREVQRQPQPDRVSRLQVRLSDVRCLLVRCVSFQARLVVLRVLSVFGNISMIVSLHFQEEHLRLRRAARQQNLVFDQRENIFTELVQFSFDFLLVLLQQFQILRSFRFFFLFDGRQGSPGSSRVKKSTFWIRLSSCRLRSRGFSLPRSARSRYSPPASCNSAYPRTSQSAQRSVTCKSSPPLLNSFERYLKIIISNQVINLNTPNITL